MLNYGLDLVELCCVYVARHTHHKRVVRGVQPRLVCKQGRGVFRGRVALFPLGILCLVDGKQLLRHGRVFGIDPFTLVIVCIFYLEAFFKAESIIEGGAEIAHLTVVAEPIDVVATRLQKAGI